MSLSPGSPSITSSEAECRGHETALGRGVAPAGSPEDSLDAIFQDIADLFGSPDDDEGGYLESMPNHRGGGTEESEIIEEYMWHDYGRKSQKREKKPAIESMSLKEIYDAVSEKRLKRLSCGKVGLKFEGVISRLDYYKFMSCMRWYCEKCGKKGGRINERRLGRVIGIMEKSGPLESLGLRQLVFTVPMEWRGRFRSRAGLNTLMKICEKIVKEAFPGRPSIAYLHCFGDKARNEGVFHPHVNIHVIEGEADDLWVEKSVLTALRARYRKALLGCGCSGQAVPDVYYSIRRGVGKVLHAVSYMSRPSPGFMDVAAIEKHPDLMALFFIDMEKFNYVRYFNGKKGVVVPEVEMTIEEMQGVAGEPLRLVEVGIKWRDFEMIHKKGDREGDYQEIAVGFFRINGPSDTESQDNKLKKEQKR